MKSRLRAVLVASGLLLNAWGWSLTIKVGSVAPVGSPWEKSLRTIAAEWRRITGGLVEMKIYMGGIAGDEPDLLRKMRIGQLQGAAVTPLGLGEIDRDVLALSTPFLIDSEEELDYVLERTRPRLVAAIEERGYRVLALSKAGWLRIFARRPVVFPEDLKRQKLAFPAGIAQLIAAWQGLGFDVAPLALPDISMGLQSGMVDATCGNTLLAAGFQWFAVAGHMSGLRVAPVVGGFLVSPRAWDQVPTEFRAPMLEAVQRADRKLYEETLALEREALGVMVRNGLVVDPLPAEAAKLWRAEMDRGFVLIVGRAFSREIYDRITALLSEFRSAAR